MPAPTSATPAPITSHRSGRAPSATQSQQMDDTIYTLPYAAYARPAVVVSILVSKYANSASDAIPGRSERGDFPKRSQAQNEKHPAISSTKRASGRSSAGADRRRRRLRRPAPIRLASRILATESEVSSAVNTPGPPAFRTGQQPNAHHRCARRPPARLFGAHVCRGTRRRTTQFSV
jgi:hypothetical protein